MVAIASDMANDDDTDLLYSRQVHLLGIKNMRKITTFKVLVVGTDNLASAIVSTLSLAGFHPTHVQTHPDEATLRLHQIAIVTFKEWSYVTLFSASCRAFGIHFLLAQTRGLSGRVFLDLGPSFSFHVDVAESEPLMMIESITQDFPATISIPEDQRLGLQDGDLVTLEGHIPGVEPMHHVPAPVTIISESSFTVPIDTRTEPPAPYVSGAYARRVPSVRQLSYLDLDSSASSPTFASWDDGCQVAAVHAVWRAIDFLEASGKVPAVENVAEVAERFWESSAGVEVDMGRILGAAMAGDRVGGPVDSIVAGITVHEVVKVCTAVHSPVHQWLYFTDSNCFPTLPDIQLAAAQQIVYEKLANQKWLVAGLGSIGCHVIKTLLAMGVGSGPDGALSLVDPATVRKSNLSSHPLFSPDQIGKPKASAALQTLRQLSPDLTVQAFSSRLDRDSEDKFGDSFFCQLSGVVSALDDSSSRLYVDSRCVANRVPMVDGGRRGTLGSVQVFVPFQSEMYASTRDPPEHRDFPICTLRNFPYLPEHAASWALECFSSLFTQRPRDVNAFLGSSDFVEQQRSQPVGAQLPVLRVISDSLTCRPIHLDSCVEWARRQFEAHFVNAIKQLLFNFPPDMRATTGALFWSGTKRVPTPLQFDPLEPSHLDFIVAASNLQARVYGLKGSQDRDYFQSVLRTVNVPSFKPKDGVMIAVTDKDIRTNKNTTAINQYDIEESVAECQRLIGLLPTPSSLAGYRLFSIEYDPDDEESDAADFISAAANLRAQNYGIPVSDSLYVRLLAGKVSPGLATTAAVTAGLLCLEIYKLAQDTSLAEFRHSYFNLGEATLVQAQPMAAIKYKVATNQEKDLEWTLWDRFEMVAIGSTLKDFLDQFKKEQGLEISTISHGKSLLYAEFLNKKKLQERMSLTLVQLVETVGRQKVPEGESHLTFLITCTDRNDDDVEVPDVVVQVR